MSLLNNFPHQCTIRRRTHTRGSTGGTKTSYTNVQTGLTCWEQPAGNQEIDSYQKQGMRITHKVYFRENPNIGRRFQILITRRNNRDGTVTTISNPVPLDVLSTALPDITAGLGVCYKVLCSEVTSEDD